MTQAGAAAPVRARRPRDRRQQIIRAAGDLFHRRGYANVGTGDIAGAVGITAGALYRHFRSKQEILACAIVDVLDQALLMVEDDEQEFDQLVVSLTRAASERRDLGVLWHRESRHLDAEEQARLHRHLVKFLTRLAGEIEIARPELPRADAELLAWFVLSVLTSPSYHSAELAPGADVELLSRCALSVASLPFDHSDDAPPVAHSRANGIAPMSRHEALIAVATRLFFERGYQSVTMDDIGAAVGMTGAGVYKHFESKPELLNATIARAAQPLQLGLSQALSRAGGAPEALQLALDAYVEFAIVHHHLVGILVSEVTNLPEQQRRSVRRAQADYVAEWVRLLRESRPELEQAQARYLVHAVLTVVNDATRTEQLMARADLDAVLRLACRSLLFVEL